MYLRASSNPLQIIYVEFTEYFVLDQTGQFLIKDCERGG